MDFNVSKENVTQKMIGNIGYQRKAVDVKELIVNGKTEIIELNHDVFDILVLSENRIVCCSFNNNCLTMYDENLNLVKRVDNISEIRFKPAGIASYDNFLYITDQLNHSIIKLDYEFNKIKSIGSLGSSFNQFNSPWGICCKDGILYTCDYENQRIQIHYTDLEFIDSVEVKYTPWLIKITNSMLFVQAGRVKSIFIYELNSLSLKHKIDKPAEVCRLSEIYSNVYRYNCQSKSVLFYDENGNLKEEIIINNAVANILSQTPDGSLIDLNGNLLMTSYSCKKFIKFSRK